MNYTEQFNTVEINYHGLVKFYVPYTYAQEVVRKYSHKDFELSAEAQASYNKMFATCDLYDYLILETQARKAGRFFNRLSEENEEATKANERNKELVATLFQKNKERLKKNEPVHAYGDHDIFVHANNICAPRRLFYY